MKNLSECLPEDIRTKQRRCVRQHNLKVFALLLIVVSVLFVSLRFLRRDSGRPDMVYCALIALGFTVGGIVAVFRSDASYCRKIEFVCPFCGKPLYYASDTYVTSPLLTRGECPKCGRKIVADGESAKQAHSA